MSIAYFTQVFPHLTMTFVYREVFGLREAKLAVQTFSVWKPKVDELSAEAKTLVDGTFYIFPLNWLAFLWHHLYYFLTRPLKYLGTLVFCLTRHHASPRDRIRTMMHFAQAVHMAREVERRGVQHIHVHFALNATTIAMVIGRLTGVTFSFTAHANDIFVNPILLPEKIKAAAFIVVPSEYNRRFLHGLVPTDDVLAKIHIVRYGVDVQAFSPGEPPRNERPIILGVAQLTEKKGYPYLVKACKILADEGRDFECQIIGRGQQEGLLKKLIDENELHGHVNLVGAVFQEDLKDYIARADIFTLPCVIASTQDRDGIPNALIEAMAMQTPTISTTVSGIPELIQDRKNGLLVPPNDEVALARAIGSLLDDEELRVTLARAGREKVVGEFEINKVTQDLIEIFTARPRVKDAQPTV